MNRQHAARKRARSRGYDMYVDMHVRMHVSLIASTGDPSILRHPPCVHHASQAPPPPTRLSIIYGITAAPPRW